MSTLKEVQKKKRDLYRKVREAERLAGGGGGVPYDRKKAQAAQVSRDNVRSGTHVPEGQDPKDPARRETCRLDFRLFCETYFPITFDLEWSPDHLKVVAKMQRAVLEGGLFALAMPRGSGKTSLAMVASIWAILYGHCRYVCLIAATATKAAKILGAIQKFLRENTNLHEDFHRELVAVLSLRGEARGATGQHCNGTHTYIQWHSEKIVFPTMPGSVASGAIVTACGLTASDIRGQFHVDADGQTVIRPDLVIPDDPQSRESAGSVLQNNTRHKLLMGDVLGMSGPSKMIAGVMPMTAIEPDDLASLMLDRQKSPDWQAEVMRMVYDFPAREDLWDQYKDIRRADFDDGGTGTKATKFYLENRAAMDKGSRVGWEARHPGAVSALQFAMNLKFRDEVAFWAEYQNEPLNLDIGDDALTTADVETKIERYDRRVVPANVQHLAAFVDVHKSLLWYSVVGFAPDMTCYLVDYGTFPDQRRRYFTMRDSRATLGRKFKSAGVEGAIRGGLDATVEMLMGRAWHQEGGGELHTGICLVDANWGEQTETVYESCRYSPHAGRLYPSHGKGIRAGNEPLVKPNDKPKPGDAPGVQWRIRLGKRKIRYAIYDVNFWKSFLSNRIKTAKGDVGSMCLFKGDHRMLTDHLLAEYPVPTEVRGRVVNEWTIKPAGPDNHLLDCLVGCCVGASIMGARLPEHGPVAPKPKKTIRLSDVQRERRGGR